MNDKSKMVVVVGTNASGKSSLGLKLAKKYDGEIISADSRQIYDGFDLCCGKVTAEERKQVTHHMLDVCQIGDNFSVSDYQKQVYDNVPNIIQRGHRVFLVGGTGLYISSVVNGYSFEKESANPSHREKLNSLSIEELRNLLSPEALQVVKNNPSDFHNKRRIIRFIEKEQNHESLTPHNDPRFDTLQIGVTWPMEVLSQRINERLSLRLEQGMLDEVDNYLKLGGNPDYLYSLGLEYRYIMWYLTGKYQSLDEFYDNMSRAIRQFAKRQLTWFKRDKSIKWIDMESDYFAQACQLIDDFYSN